MSPKITTTSEKPSPNVSVRSESGELTTEAKRKHFFPEPSSSAKKMKGKEDTLEKTKEPNHPLTKAEFKEVIANFVEKSETRKLHLRKPGLRPGGGKPPTTDTNFTEKEKLLFLSLRDSI